MKNVQGKVMESIMEEEKDKKRELLEEAIKWQTMKEENEEQDNIQEVLEEIDDKIQGIVYEINDQLIDFNNEQKQLRVNEMRKVRNRMEKEFRYMNKNDKFLE